MLHLLLRLPRTVLLALSSITLIVFLCAPISLLPPTAQLLFLVTSVSFVAGVAAYLPKHREKASFRRARVAYQEVARFRADNPINRPLLAMSEKQVLSQVKRSVAYQKGGWWKEAVLVFIIIVSCVFVPLVVVYWVQHPNWQSMIFTAVALLISSACPILYIAYHKDEYSTFGDKVKFFFTVAAGSLMIIQVLIQGLINF
jgi:hypothetical protein